MKICLVAPANNAHARRFINLLIQHGYQVALVSPQPVQVTLPSEVELFDLARLSNLPRLRFLAWRAALPGLLRRIQPDLLHAFGAAGASWLASAGRFHPFVITAMGSDLLLLGQRSWLHNRLTRQALRQADYLLCLSEGLRQAALGLGVPAERCAVAFFGLDLEHFHPGQQPTAGQPDQPTILSLRAIQPVYNPLSIAAAIPTILAEFPQARFQVLTYNADPALLAQFKASLAAAGASQSVDYLPPIESDQQLGELYRRCDIAISVAESDGTPVSVLESMACGCALVASDLPTLRQWIEPGASGLLVPPGDSPALTEAVLQLLRQPALRLALGRRAAQLASQRAGQEAQFARVTALYQRLAGAQP
jgi:glycosyltransferase involved in cell wall biosynthesis